MYVLINNARAVMRLRWLYVAIFLIMLMVGGWTKQRNLIVDWEKFESCPNFDNHDFDFSEAYIYRDDVSTIALRGVAKLNVDVLSGPVKITVTFNKKVSGGSYPVLNYEIADICDKIGQKGSDWEPYVQGFVPVPPDTCPVYKTNFNLSNVKSNLNTIALNKDMVGKYNAIIDIFRPADVKRKTFPGFQPQLLHAACYSLDFNIITD